MTPISHSKIFYTNENTGFETIPYFFIYIEEKTYNNYNYYLKNPKGMHTI